MSPVTQLLAFPFRIFFLSTALWGLVAVGLWAFQVSGVLDLPLAYQAMAWHRHEMLFGFLNPAIAGFLLTAVCVWTGTERLHGMPLLCLWLVWLAGRLLATWGGPDLAGWSSAVNLAFLPLVAADAGWRIARARQWRQLVVLAILVLLWLMEAGLLLEGRRVFADGGLLLAAALMLVIGGRITPSFSANWLRARGGDGDGVRVLRPLEVALLASLAALLLAAFWGGATAIALTALVAAAVALVRIALWRGWLVLREPLLWILHLSLLWIPVALVLLAGHHLAHWPATAWQHALGIGAMGGLILGVMTRVALGHTGRPMQLPGGMVTAYLLVQGAVLVRLATVFGAIPWQPGVSATAIFWALALVLFLWRYVGVLCSPRVDGKPG